MLFNGGDEVYHYGQHARTPEDDAQTFGALPHYWQQRERHEVIPNRMCYVVVITVCYASLPGIPPVILRRHTPKVSCRGVGANIKRRGYRHAERHEEIGEGYYVITLGLLSIILPFKTRDCDEYRYAYYHGYGDAAHCLFALRCLAFNMRHMRITMPRDTSHNDDDMMIMVMLFRCHVTLVRR